MAKKESIKLKKHKLDFFYFLAPALAFLLLMLGNFLLTKSQEISDSRIGILAVILLTEGVFISFRWSIHFENIIVILKNMFSLKSKFYYRIIIILMLFVPYILDSTIIFSYIFYAASLIGCTIGALHGVEILENKKIRKLRNAFLSIMILYSAYIASVMPGFFYKKITEINFVLGVDVLIVMFIATLIQFSIVFFGCNNFFSKERFFSSK